MSPSPSRPAPSDTEWLSFGTPAYRRASLALFLAGFATFSLLYSVQPLLPEFATHFAISPAESAMALSVTTATLAISIVLAGVFSQMLGRRGVMFVSMASASVLNMAIGLLDNWPAILAARALEGFLLGGVPAVAMAYIAEEMHPRNLGRAMGLYVAGTALGGMIGRVVVGFVSEWMSWQAAMSGHGALCLAASAGFLALLPPSRHFVRSARLDPAHHLRLWAAQIRAPALRSLFGVSFLIMGCFVTLFNYAGFRLLQPPFNLSQATISLIFLAYGVGAFASSLSGRLADRFGQGRLLAGGLLLLLAGSLITLSQSLAVVVGGIVLVAIGFFTSHAVASSWVGRLAGTAKGHAASLYLLAYYLGSSVLGMAGGWFWQHGGWSGVIAMNAFLLLMALVLCANVSRRAEV